MYICIFIKIYLYTFEVYTSMSYPYYSKKSAHVTNQSATTRPTACSARLSSFICALSLIVKTTDRKYPRACSKPLLYISEQTSRTSTRPDSQQHLQKSRVVQYSLPLFQVDIQSADLLFLSLFSCKKQQKAGILRAVFESDVRSAEQFICKKEKKEKKKKTGR